MITAAHSILTSCCFTTSTSAKEKKYKREWKVLFIIVQHKTCLWSLLVPPFEIQVFLWGHYFRTELYTFCAKLRNPHGRSKKEVWVTLSPTWDWVEFNKDEWSNGWEIQEETMLQVSCTLPTNLEGRKGRQMVGSTRSIQIVRCVKASRSSTSIIFMRNFSFKTLHPF